ncbi:hypothetical protein DPMN_105775 [Dreissena polymorpha]|uniref:Uncharacterized protein n=1 Tax=Dreissena polymorpha TaxID=45954 RepID=A0A9D4QJ07_DREPO|nr:hypothetical protein DPMN_105775 [Dreissena polymorpha]
MLTSCQLAFIHSASHRASVRSPVLLLNDCGARWENRAGNYRVLTSSAPSDCS